MTELNSLSKIITTIFGIMVAVMFCLYAVKPLTNDASNLRIGLFILVAIIYLCSICLIWLKTKQVVFLIVAAIALIATVLMICYVPFFHGYLMVEAIGFYLAFYVSVYLMNFTDFKYRASVSLTLEFLIVIVMICFS
ncbi:CHASE2 domain-containing sensor protein [Lactobacillus colini]|uniref:CHASE2 domain-containing sensor protein n=1 Tax=Lactobacillus colini TaxID=1819254 RepID=A0ABS4MES0_9LACO|nr:hypothetical protein [Lactobacillus colini]MBP2058185.1 CHASE2 domain-containing sensor protein [Lactobacillus colini]